MRAQLGFSGPGAGSKDAVFFIRRTKTSCGGTGRYLIRPAGTIWYRNCGPAGPRMSRPVDGWRLAANAIRLVEAEGRSDGRAANSYFVSLYQSLADALASGAGFLSGLDGARAYRPSRSGAGGSGGNGGSVGVRRIDKGLPKPGMRCATWASPGFLYRLSSAPRQWSWVSTSPR